MQLSDQHHTTPRAYTPPVLGGDTDQHELRVLIDEVATTRGLTIQLSMRVMAYHAAPDAQVRAAVCAEFNEMHCHFNRNLELVFGTAEIERRNPSHVAQLRSAAARDPSRAIAMRCVAAQIEQVARTMSAGLPIGFDQARAFFSDNWPTARDCMTQVIWDIWADLDTARLNEVQVATQAAHSLGDRLDRLERIGKHVRLVSLNASVEAAHAGDVGKGLMVIAQEFKTLAEEIQSLANDAREDMNSIS